MHAAQHTSHDSHLSSHTEFGFFTAQTFTNHCPSQVGSNKNSEIFRFDFNNLKEWSHIFRKNALSAFKSWMRTPPISCLYSKYKAAACRLLLQCEDCQLLEAAALFLF